MKIALVHDYLKEYGGAERVLEALHELYPDATVFTSVYLPEFLGPHKKRFANWKIKTSWLQKIPFISKMISPLRLFTPFVFNQFDFSVFDIIIVSATGAYLPNLIHKKNAIQICYCHTPPRYLYGYATAREWKKHIFFKVLAQLANHFLRRLDFIASKRVDYYISNSHEVKRRIRKFYRREATVIYPPVEIVKIESQIPSEKAKEYFITGGRLARPKHVDLIIKTCVQNNLALKVFGKAFAGYGEELQALAKNSDSLIEFMGEVTDEKKYQLLSGAKAFLFASEDEDLGITPIEAMSCGIPVVAYRSGGVQETILEQKTGLFFQKLSIESLQTAIRKLGTLKIDPKECRKHAEKFSKERFMKEVREFVNQVKNKE